MSTPPPTSPAEELASTGLALRKVLLRLDGWAKARVKTIKEGQYAEAARRHVSDIDELMVAVKAYGRAVESAMVQASHEPIDISHMTPAELLTYRETDPMYKLGFVRGYKRGEKQATESREKAITLYSEHAGLPPPVGASALVRRVHLIIAFQQDPSPLTLTKLETLRENLQAASRLAA